MTVLIYDIKGSFGENFIHCLDRLRREVNQFQITPISVWTNTVQFQRRFAELPLSCWQWSSIGNGLTGNNTPKEMERCDIAKKKCARDHSTEGRFRTAADIAVTWNITFNCGPFCHICEGSAEPRKGRYYLRLLHFCAFDHCLLERRRLSKPINSRLQFHIERCHTILRIDINRGSPSNGMGHLQNDTKARRRRIVNRNTANRADGRSFTRKTCSRRRNSKLWIRTGSSQKTCGSLHNVTMKWYLPHHQISIHQIRALFV
jgi:hypothetical protein